MNPPEIHATPKPWHSMNWILIGSGHGVLIHWHLLYSLYNWVVCHPKKVNLATANTWTSFKEAQVRYHQNVAFGNKWQHALIQYLGRNKNTQKRNAHTHTYSHTWCLSSGPLKHFNWRCLRTQGMPHSVPTTLANKFVWWKTKNTHPRKCNGWVHLKNDDFPSSESPDFQKC